MKKRRGNTPQLSVQIAAWLGACMCFIFGFFIGNGVMFSAARGSKAGAPPQWLAQQIDSPLAQVAGAILCVAIGLLILVRTYGGSVTDAKRPKRTKITNRKNL